MTLEEKIMAIRTKNTPEVDNTQPVAETAPTTVEAVPTEGETKTEEAEPIVESPQSEKTEQPSSEQVEAPTGWDDDTNEVEVTPLPQIDYSELGSALSLDGVKSKEDFIAKASEIKSKLKEYEEAPLKSVPEDLREVIEVAKTGDWKEYLASQILDYNQFDPVEEFVNDFKFRASKDPRFHTDGKPDPQKIQEALDTFSEAQRSYEGQRILEYKALQQQRHRESLKAKAEAKRAEAERNLATATSKLGEILPLETYGIKFESKHSSEIYNGILNSKLTKKHLGLSYEELVRSGADMKSIVRTVTLAEKGEKMIAFKSDKSKVDGKKEVLKTIQNVQLNTTGAALNPEQPEDKPKSPVDKMKEYLAMSRKGL